MVIITVTGEKYIGETSRSIRLRFNEHRKNGKNGEHDTPFGEHMLQSHPDLEPRDTSMTVKILRVCKDEADRKITETICIRDARPKINDNSTSWHIL